MVMKKNKKDNKKKYIIIVISIALLILVCFIIDNTIFMSNIPDDKGKDSEKYPVDKEVIDMNCDVDDNVLLSAVNEFQKETALYKYFSKEIPISTEFVESRNYDFGKGCIVTTNISNIEFNYVYLKSEGKAYGYSDSGVYYDIKKYNTATLYFYVKDFILGEEIQNKYKGYGTYPVDYDDSNKFYIEIREYNGEGKNGGELIAKYTVNLNTKQYTVEDYR